MTSDLLFFKLIYHKILTKGSANVPPSEGEILILAKDQLIIIVATLAILFLVYNFLIFRLAARILECPKLNGLKSLPVGIINAAILVLAGQVERSGFVYIVFFVLLLLELAIFHKDKFSRVLFVGLAHIIHFMVIKAMCSAVTSMLTGVSLFGIHADSFLSAVCASATLLLLCVAILLVLKFIPTEKIRILNKHDEQLWFLIVWLAVFCTYLLLNSRVYDLDEAFSLLNEMQLLSSFAIIIGLYIVLLFSFRISALLGYEATNKELRADLNKEKQYREAILRDSLAAYEFNLNGNKIVAGFDEYKDSLGERLVASYTEMLDFLAGKLVLKEDIPGFLNFVSAGNLHKTLSAYKNEITFEYRRLGKEGRYIWVRATTDLAKDKATGEIKGFTYIKDIDEEKRTQLELQFRAERDSLTGLYNKGMTAKRVNERLSSLRGKYHALFIIDIDNFKNVNDSYGHACGDNVLCEIAERLTLSFRKEDIIGRVGGDEFIALMANIGDVDAVNAKAVEMCDTMRSAINDVSLSISVGVAVSPAFGTYFSELYKNADAALYESKKNGKDSYTVYS